MYSCRACVQDLILVSSDLEEGNNPHWTNLPETKTDTRKLLRTNWYLAWMVWNVRLTRAEITCSSFYLSGLVRQSGHVPV